MYAFVSGGCAVGEMPMAETREGPLAKLALRAEAALWFPWCPVGEASTLLVLLAFLSGVGGRSEVLIDISL